MKTFLRSFAIFLLLFLGFGAIYGGWMLISDPSGAKFQWTTEFLKGTPFKSFLIPGIALIVVNGFLPIYISVLIIIRSKYYTSFLIFQGCILMVWLTAEILFNRELYSSAMHPPCYIIALLLIIIGLAIRKLK
jgi:hypothetical protein